MEQELICKKYNKTLRNTTEQEHEECNNNNMHCYRCEHLKEGAEHE